MRSFRQKLITSYGLLIVVIFAVSAWSIYHLVSLGRAIDVILVNNYKSIVAAERMKEALERLDSAALFFIAAQAEKSRRQFADNVARFEEEYAAAASNLTEAGEAQILADIEGQFAAYKSELGGFIAATGNGASGVAAAAKVDAGRLSAHYFARLEPGFLALKDRLDNLLNVNQQAMLTANERALSQSWQAEVSVAMMALFVVAVAGTFAWRFADAVSRPVAELAAKAKLIGDGDFDQHIAVGAKDEIGTLAAEFNRMTARLRALRQSEHWRMLLERKKSDAVIESLYEPVIVTDAQGHVTKVNRSAAELFRQSRNAEVDDQDYSLSGLSAGEQILRAVRAAVALQRPVAQEGDAALVPMKVGGDERSYRLRATPVRDADGRLIGAVTLLEDVTSMKQVDDVKSEFISIASAKLRDPLRALQLALYSLIEGYAGELTDRQAELLLDARQNAEQLNELIGDLLELSEIESGTRALTTERLRPVELARQAVERFQAAADARHITLTSQVTADLPWVIADRRAMRRVFDNLLSNAIRHTPRNGEVNISAEERLDRVFFRVSDSGEGIPEEHLPRLFNRFVKIGEQTSGGTGLGLALTRRLIEAQGGQISVESRVGEGTTFTFTLPVGAPSTARR